jgi:hypothetical protein
MTSRPLLPYFLVPALPLLVPLLGSQLSRDVDWSVSDYLIAYVLFAGAGFAYRFATLRADTLAYRMAAGLAVFGCLSLIWVNLAVGFNGDEDNPANLLYGAVLVTAAVGTVRANFRAAGLARAMFAASAVQFCVPIVAWVVWRANFDVGVARIFFFNACWAFLFLLSGLLFRSSARQAPAGR